MATVCNGGTAGTWYYWTSDTGTGSTSATTYDDPWNTWTTGVTSATTTNDAVWYQWTAPNDGSATYKIKSVNSDGSIWVEWTAESDPNVIHVPSIQTPVQTPEEIAAAAKAIAEAAEAAQRAREERARIQAAEQAERNRIQREANIRAEDLLLSVLNRRQVKEWKEKHQISIYQNGYKHPKYILKNQSASNVCEYDKKGKRIIEHCVQTVGVPLCDQLAAQVLYLKNAPEELLRVANHFPVRQN